VNPKEFKALGLKFFLEAPIHISTGIQNSFSVTTGRSYSLSVPANPCEISLEGVRPCP
jgi:hypothetical protein